MVVKVVLLILLMLDLTIDSAVIICSTPSKASRCRLTSVVPHVSESQDIGGMRKKKNLEMPFLTSSTKHVFTFSGSQSFAAASWLYTFMARKYGSGSPLPMFRL